MNTTYYSLPWVMLQVLFTVFPSFSCLFTSSCPSLTVRRVPPRFSIPPTNHEVMPGGSINLTCVAVGAPMPFVKWMKGETELTKEEEMPIGRNVLELNNIRQSANYTCVAMSSLGIIETTAQIIVKGKSHIKWHNTQSQWLEKNGKLMGHNREIFWLE